jgi:hypothetical protein
MDMAALQLQTLGRFGLGIYLSNISRASLSIYFLACLSWMKKAVSSNDQVVHFGDVSVPDVPVLDLWDCDQSFHKVWEAGETVHKSAFYTF